MNLKITAIFIVFLYLISTHNVVVFAKEINPADFEEKVLVDKRVWLVEFFSGMCGSCQEFAPEWKKLEEAVVSSIKLGQVNIDTKEGLHIAQSLGALDDIPCVMIFTKKASTSIGAGGSGTGGELLKLSQSDMNKKSIMKKVKTKLKGMY